MLLFQQAAANVEIIKNIKQGANYKHNVQLLWPTYKTH